MPRKILVTGGSAGAIDLVEVAASNEHELQEILRANPQLIPAEDLGLSGDLLVVGRETRLVSGAIDLLCLSRTGELLIIEFKTGPKNPDFRHALAQVIDYGSDIWMLGDWTSFDQGVVHRYLNSQYVEPKYKSCADLREAVTLAWALPQDEWDSLTDRLDQVIKKGDFHFIVAAQRFVDSMKTSVSYLNSTTQAGRYFRGSHPARRCRGRRRTPPKSSTNPRVGAALTQPRSQSVRRRLPGGHLRPRVPRGYERAFRLRSGARLDDGLGVQGSFHSTEVTGSAEPISVGWVFLEGDQWTWAKHVTLGVDPNTLQNHPSIQAAILAFCQKLKGVPGGKPAGGKSNAVIFEPTEFVAVRDDLIGLLGDLASAATASAEPPTHLSPQIVEGAVIEVQNDGVAVRILGLPDSSSGPTSPPGRRGREPRRGAPASAPAKTIPADALSAMRQHGGSDLIF